MEPSPRTAHAYLVAILAAVVLSAIGATPARADKCNSAKIKAIGKKEAGLLGCSAKEATKGTSVEPACNTSVSGKFTPAYNKPTGCAPAAPAAGTCETTADNCQTTLRGLLPDGNGTTPSKCEASRLKAAGKLASAELGCYSKAAATGVPIDTVGCIPKATGKFTMAFNKVSGCSGDGNASGIQTDVENDCVNNMVDVSGGSFVAITCGGATTTTTTTMSATSTTTTTTISGTSTTTTTLSGAIVVGSLPKTPGRFNYVAMLGLAGADSACNTNFPGAHACTLTELQDTPSGVLVGLKDTTNMTVTSFWAIDPTANPLTAQCHDDVNFPCTGTPPNETCPPGHTWEYGTAHTMSRGQTVSLNNATGAIGPLVTGLQCNFEDDWVGCCR